MTLFQPFLIRNTTLCKCNMDAFQDESLDRDLSRL